MKIYKITNSINNKVYIGKTIYSLKKRFQGHTSADNGTKICLAIKELGKQFFKIEHIDSAKSPVELHNKERYWIMYYDSINNGYNEMLPAIIEDNRIYEYGTLKPKNRFKFKSNAYIYTPVKDIYSLKRLPNEFEIEYWYKMKNKC